MTRRSVLVFEVNKRATQVCNELPKVSDKAIDRMLITMNIDNKLCWPTRPQQDTALIMVSSIALGLSLIAIW